MAHNRSLSMKILFLTLITFILLSGCGLTTGSRLEAIDELLPQYPDSALTSLEQIKSNQLWFNSEKAYHALLTTEARYYSGIDERDDSLISSAAYYYTLRDRNPLKMRAYYHKGIIQSNDSNYSDALVSYMMGAQTAKLIGDIRHLALIYRSIGDTFDKMGRHQSAAVYYDKSYRGFKSLEDSVYTTYAIYDLARSYSNYAQYDSCIVKAKECLHYAEKGNDSTLIGLTLSLLGKSYKNINQFEDAIYTIRRLLREYPSISTYKDWNSLGIAYLYSGNPIMAQQCEDSIKKISEEQSWLSYLLAQYNQDYKSALGLLKMEYKSACNHQIEEVSSDTEEELFEHMFEIREKAQNEKNILILIAYSITVTTLLLGAIVIILFKRKNVKLENKNNELSNKNYELEIVKNHLEKELAENELTIQSIKSEIEKQKNKISAYLEKLSSLRDMREMIEKELYEARNENDVLNQQIELHKSEIDNMREMIRVKDEEIGDKEEVNGILLEKLKNIDTDLKNKGEKIESLDSKLRNAVVDAFRTLDKLTNLYYEFNGMLSGKDKLSLAVQKLIEDFSKGEKRIREMENFINANFDNLIADFRNDFPNLNEYEYEHYIFLVLHISPKSISVFQDVIIDNIYNRKANLIRKIKSKGEDAKRDYLKYI